MTTHHPCTIAAAQTASIANDVAANTATHLRAVQKAAAHGADVVVFPELSFTGYEFDKAAELAFRSDDPRLTPLREAAVRHTMTILAGGPLHPSCITPTTAATGVARPYLGCLLARSDGSLHTYAKIHVHTGEDAVFAPGTQHMVLPAAGETVGVAICADTCNATHPARCAQMGASVYAAGVLISKQGYAADAALFAEYAAQHGMVTLMANHCGPTGGWEPAGKSCIWLPDGQHRHAPEHEQALVLGRREPHGWTLQTVLLDD